MTVVHPIEVRGASKRYGEIQAVDGLDVTVPEGSCVGLLGPNGAGKSTTMRMLTAQTVADDEVKRNGERLALAAEGANDGLWQWNLRTKEFYVSGRWREMIGLPPNANIGGPEDWLERVHADDIAGLLVGWGWLALLAHEAAYPALWG